MKLRTPLVEIPEPEIQHAAYYLWQEKGRPLGCDLEIWLAAKELLKHRQPRRSTGHTSSRVALRAESSKATAGKR